jgi:hypothetical protein
VDALRINGLVLVAMLLSLPLLAVGVNADQFGLTVAGVALFGLAALVPPALRFIDLEEE